MNDDQDKINLDNFYADRSSSSHSNWIIVKRMPAIIEKLNSKKGD